jgi:hypothetical protein
LVPGAGNKATTSAEIEMKTGQEVTKEVPEEPMQKDSQFTDATDQRKLDDVIMAARVQKATQEEGMFREQTIPAGCRASTLEEQGISVDNCAISAHKWRSDNILIINITEKWTSMEDLISLLERANG